MRRYLLLLLLLAAACSTNESPARANSTSGASSTFATRDRQSDSVAIRATLDGWYRAMQSLDSAGTLSPLTPQFLLLEDTLPLSGPALYARLKQGGTDARWTAEFSDMRTRILGDVAWTTLRNQETSEGSDGRKCQADFLETIVFVRDTSRWLIDRYHAAALHRWSCGA